MNGQVLRIRHLYIAATAEQRLVLALAVAGVFHVLILLGIRFTIPSVPTREPVLSLNITLLEKAGGEPDVPSAPVPPPAALSPPAPPPPAEPPTPVAEPPQRTTTAVTETIAPKQRTAKPTEPQIAKPPPAPSLPSGAELRDLGLQMARMETVAEPPSNNTREKRLDPDSMTTLEGFYVESWRRKVEQVGTLNFPDEARRLGLTTGPTLDVAIRADGSIYTIRVVRSSGHKALDEAARQIVELAAPYSPFPKELRRQFDILHIVRKWKFEHGTLTGR